MKEWHLNPSKGRALLKQLHQSHFLNLSTHVGIPIHSSRSAVHTSNYLRSLVVSHGHHDNHSHVILVSLDRQVLYQELGIVVLVSCSVAGALPLIFPLSAMRNIKCQLCSQHQSSLSQGPRDLLIEHGFPRSSGSNTWSFSPFFLLRGIWQLEGHHGQSRGRSEAHIIMVIWLILSTSKAMKYRTVRTKPESE